MAKDQKVTLTFDMTDNTRKTVAFTVPAGKDGTNGVGIIDITATQEDITD